MSRTPAQITNSTRGKIQFVRKQSWGGKTWNMHRLSIWLSIHLAKSRLIITIITSVIITMQKGRESSTWNYFSCFFFGSQISFLGLGGCFKVWYDGKRETVSRCALMKKVNSLRKTVIWERSGTIIITL